MKLFSRKKIKHDYIFQNLVEFLTKEVTHVISEGPEWKFLVLSSGKCGPPSPWTPGAATPSPSTSLDVRYFVHCLGFQYLNALVVHLYGHSN